MYSDLCNARTYQHSGNYADHHSGKYHREDCFAALVVSVPI